MEPMSEAAPTPDPEEPAAPVGSGYFYWVTKVVLTPVLTLAFRPRIEGVRHVPSRGPAILACNHVSYLDWLFLPLVRGHIGAVQQATGRPWWSPVDRLDAIATQSLGSVMAVSFVASYCVSLISEADM